MEITTIDVERRSATGSAKVARLRDEGKVPAVLYGAGGDALTLAVGERDLQRHVRQHHKVFRLSMDGKEQAIFLQQVQWDCLTDRPLHVDFLRIDLSKPLNIVVELNYLGHPVGISKGGRLVRDLNEVKVTCLPEAIPESIAVQVGHLELSEKTTAADLEMPEGVVLDMPLETVVAHMTGDETVLEVEEEATEAVAEGDEPPAGDPAPDGAGDS
jgi:large subunit ribosomal protein L25